MKEEIKICKCGHEQAAHINFGYACQVDYNLDDCLKFEEIESNLEGK